MLLIARNREHTNTHTHTSVHQNHHHVAHIAAPTPATRTRTRPLLHIAVLAVGVLDLLFGFARRPPDQGPRARLQLGLAARLRQQIGPRLLRAQRRTVHASFAYASNQPICTVSANLSNAPAITFTRGTHVRRRSPLEATARRIVCRAIRAARAATGAAPDAAVTHRHNARQLQQRFEQQTDVVIDLRGALEHLGPHLGQFAVQPLGDVLQHDLAMRGGQIGLVAGDHDGDFLHSQLLH